MCDFCMIFTFYLVEDETYYFRVKILEFSFSFTEETKQVLRLSLTEFSLPKFYLLFGISKVKSAAVIAFRSSYRDRAFSPGSYERETFALTSLETVTEALLEIMEV